MKKTLISAVAAAITFAAPAMAWEGTTVACFDKHLVPAQYSATKVLVKAGKQQLCFAAAVNWHLHDALVPKCNVCAVG